MVSSTSPLYGTSTVLPSEALEKRLVTAFMGRGKTNSVFTEATCGTVHCYSLSFIACLSVVPWCSQALKCFNSSHQYYEPEEDTSWVCFNIPYRSLQICPPLRSIMHYLQVKLPEYWKTNLTLAVSSFKGTARLRPRVKMWELSLSRFWAAELCRALSHAIDQTQKCSGCLLLARFPRPSTDIVGNLLQKAAAQLTPEAKKWNSTSQRQTKRIAKNKSTVNTIKYGLVPTQVCTVPKSTSEDKRFQANNFHLFPLSFPMHSNSSCSGVPPSQADL